MASKTDFPPVRACLFDMDGLLIDSEDIYTLCTNIILHANGRPNLPWNIKAQLQGRPGPEAGAIFMKWANLPFDHDEFYKRQAAHQRIHFPNTQPLPGVEELLKTLSKASPTVHIALASSSNTENFKLKSTHLESFFSVFSPERMVLGDDPRVPKGRGKPEPDIYLLALKLINDGLAAEGKEPPITPEECLVFEDSVPGIEAGRKAGMRTVWVPHPALRDEFKGKEKLVLAGEGKLALQLMSEAANKTAEEALDERSAALKEGKDLTELDDGWGQLLESLENFPYQWYGIHVTNGDKASI